MIMETRKKRPFQNIICADLILAACTNATDTSETQTSKISPPDSATCSKAFLASTSDDFLNALKSQNLTSAISFYEKVSSLDENEHDAAYTFFPNHNENGIFDFHKANADSEFEADILGEYNHLDDIGMLVLFIQKKHISKRRNIEFLSETKFQNYFTCYFECINEVWKITGYGCFEDSGGPFFPICEEGDLDEYCP